MAKKRATVLIAARNIHRSTGTGRTIIEHARFLSHHRYQVIVAGESIDQDVISKAGAVSRRTLKLPFGKRLRRRAFSSQVDALRSWHNPEVVWGHGDNLNQDVLSLHNCVHLAHETMRPFRGDRISSVASLHAKQLRAQQFKLLIANSTLMKRDLISRFNVSADLIRVIHPGYDPVQFSTTQREHNRQKLRQEWRLNDNALILGLVTSGDFVKRNVKGCLRAFAELKKTTANIKLVIIGKQSPSHPIHQLIAELGLGQDLILLSPRPDIQAIFHALDLCVHPAHIEEFGQVVQEAIMCGTPVLTSRMVGATDLFPDEPDVLIMDKPDLASLVTGMKVFIEREDYRRVHTSKVQATMRHNTWNFNCRATVTALAEKCQLPDRD